MTDDPSSAPDASFWDSKLNAFLHDSPSKALDIKSHEDRAKSSRSRAFGDGSSTFDNRADHTAASTDRFPFPASRSSGLSSAFDGIENGFRHPFAKTTLSFGSSLNVAKAEEIEQMTQPCWQAENFKGSDAEKARARFFLHWRLWKKHAVENDWRMGFMPADTRLPDHTIWNHIQVTSAFQGCIEDGILKPAFIRFNLGGVQTFISQARSTRDLWSGSYLLSWIMAAGLKRLSELAGPDAVIFPSLLDQPLFDLQWRDELWDKIPMGKKSKSSADADSNTFQSLWSDDESLLIPSLPNTFLALVPQSRADAIAKAVEQAVREEWQKIARSVGDAIKEKGAWADESGEALETRFYRQVKHFLQPSWSVFNWPESLDQLKTIAEEFDPKAYKQGGKAQSTLERFKLVLDVAQRSIPREHRDERFYSDGEKTRLKNIGIAWPLANELSSKHLAGVRQLRTFDGWNVGDGSERIGKAFSKDSISGSEEAVVESKNLRKAFGNRFKKDDLLGAPLLVKRLWDLTYLEEKGIEPPKWSSTRSIAQGKPYSNDAEDDEDVNPDDPNYFAVLALDGDEMGKWISGEKNMKFFTRLSGYKGEKNNESKKQEDDKTGKDNKKCEEKKQDKKAEEKLPLEAESSGALKYFLGLEDEKVKALLETPRMVSPSFHLQFSESLGNFSIRCAGLIVEQYNGRLIYAGGDDVLALLPAKQAIPCAEALRAAFTGRKHEQSRVQPRMNADDGTPIEGFVSIGNRPEGYIVPGPEMDCSVGIAIAHFSHPLQDVVREAHSAEKRAKKQLGRAAFAVSLIKRSGEKIEWGAKWKHNALEVYKQISDGLDHKTISSRFPYRVAQLLSPYLSQPTPLLKDMQKHETSSKSNSETEWNACKVIDKEVEHALERQAEKLGRKGREAITDLLNKYLMSIKTHDADTTSTSSASVNEKKSQEPMNQTLLNATIGLMQTLAFIHRQPSENGNA